VKAYLRVLGVTRAEPSLEALHRLVRAHLMGIPFENISRLYRCRVLGLRDVPDLDLFLAGEQHHLGGTCYANNFHFYRLLDALGYDAALCGADMPSGEDVHAAILVSIDGGEFLVDAGYATPRPIEHFLAVVRGSFDEKATSMNSVMLVRFLGATSVTVHNLTLLHPTAAGSTVEPLADRQELAAAIERHFEVPAAIVNEAIGDRAVLRGVYA